jgi:hypothetical protein
MTPRQTQQTLFTETIVDPIFEHNARVHSVPLRDLDIGDITFLAGQDEPIHRWYRLTPSFSPGLVRFFLQHFAVEKDDLVLDPFSGRGTTMIECQRNLHSGIGFEINPLLQRVGSLSLNWSDLDPRLVRRYLERLASLLTEHEESSPERVAESYGVRVPDIHDVYRWWQPAVLRDLLIAREEADRSDFAPIKHFLWLAVNAASLDCANIHRNHPTITFDDDHGRSIDAFGTIQANLLAMIADCALLSRAQRAASGRCRVEHANSCETVAHTHQARGRVRCIITSPPYPNRYSYVHQTRPQLHFMEVIPRRGDATDIDLQTIGGTWGKATSNLMNTLMEPAADIAPLLTYFSELSGRSVLMCNYATKYFLDMDRHIAAMRPLADPGRFRGAYVVGNSRLSGVEIFTETILARLFQRHGFEVEEILVFRKRGGRKRLYETAVIVRA